MVHKQTNKQIFGHFLYFLNEGIFNFFVREAFSCVYTKHIKQKWRPDIIVYSCTTDVKLVLIVSKVSKKCTRSRNELVHF